MSTTSHWVSLVFVTLVLFSEKCVFSNTCTFLEHLRSQTLAKCSHRINAPPLQPVDALSAQLALLLCSIPCDSEGSLSPSSAKVREWHHFLFPKKNDFQNEPQRKPCLCWLHSNFFPSNTSLPWNGTPLTSSRCALSTRCPSPGQGMGACPSPSAVTHNLWPLSYQHCHVFMLSMPEG